MGRKSIVFIRQGAVQDGLSGETLTPSSRYSLRQAAERMRKARLRPDVILVSDQTATHLSAKAVCATLDCTAETRQFPAVFNGQPDEIASVLRGLDDDGHQTALVICGAHLQNEWSRAFGAQDEGSFIKVARLSVGSWRDVVAADPFAKSIVFIRQGAVEDGLSGETLTPSSRDSLRQAAERMRNAGLMPDVILVSDRTATHLSAKAVCATLVGCTAETRQSPAVFNGQPDEIASVLRGLDDHGHQTALVICGARLQNEWSRAFGAQDEGPFIKVARLSVGSWRDVVAEPFAVTPVAPRRAAAPVAG